MANENGVSYGTIVVATDGSPSSLEGAAMPSHWQR